jgi:DNA-binding GntR family transcriptional regulator
LQRLESTTLADQAYAALREAIISGELAPNEKITERGLAERLSVSPTPIREALRRLEQDRLVERRGPRLVQVVDLDDRSAAEVRLAEGALRAVAAGLAAQNATGAQLRRMERLLDAGDLELARVQARHADGRRITADDLAPLLAITRQFHAELNEGCNNAVVLRLLGLVDAFSLASRRGRLAGELGVGAADSALARFHEHRAVFDAVRAGDAEAAERLMRDHVHVQAPEALEPLER